MGTKQAEMIEQSRNESALDPSVPLDLPVAPRPEPGESCEHYFERTHSTVGPGQFWPLHETQPGRPLSHVRHNNDY
jgi:hypothetical protein